MNRLANLSRRLALGGVLVRGVVDAGDGNSGILQLRGGCHVEASPAGWLLVWQWVEDDGEFWLLGWETKIGALLAFIHNHMA